jgi:hypothetical protein
LTHLRVFCYLGINNLMVIHFGVNILELILRDR